FFPLRIRLTIFYGFWMALLLPVLGWGLLTLVERTLMQSVDAALYASSQAMIDSRVGIDDNRLDQLLNSLLGERHINTSARIVDLSGKVRSYSHQGQKSLPMSRFATDRAQTGLSSIETFNRRNNAAFRMLTVPIISEGRFSGDVIQVGASLETTEAALKEIGAVLWFAFPVALIFVLGFGYYLTGGSLSPVVAIQIAAANLSGTDLTNRLPLPKAKDELRGLTETFNGMLDRLQDTFGRLRRFSADVSHELKTPLSAIRGEAELALRRDRSQGDYQEVLRTIQRESIHMSKIVDDLLLLARAESKSVAFVPEFVESDELVQTCSLAVRSCFSDRGVLLAIVNSIDCPICCAPGYLTLAIINILTNAAKHSPKDQVVQMTASNDSLFHYFTISDLGEGIPSDQVNRVFDPFYRVDSARNREVGGAGIGLSLAMALVRMHGGGIQIESKVGKGTSFEIKIPRIAQA
ncbi:MAG: ATP-binding protein, partial [Proteobacteria bacterium]|nr:ATP-binding protein [Pseudomonadota bacterium]